MRPRPPRVGEKITLTWRYPDEIVDEEGEITSVFEGECVIVFLPGTEDDKPYVVIEWEDLTWTPPPPVWRRVLRWFGIR